MIYSIEGYWEEVKEWVNLDYADSEDEAYKKFEDRKIDHPKISLRIVDESEDMVEIEVNPDGPTYRDFPKWKSRADLEAWPA